MSDRRALLDALATPLADLGVPVGWAVGGTKAAEENDGGVLLATYAYAAEGMDVPDLDTCVLATPRCEIRQCIGRILRRRDHTPLVVDIVDTSMRTQFLRRRRWYTRPIDRDGLGARVNEAVAL